ncbi:hypothetical protein HDV06_000018 [Boothiomyces sp. JEL0866]|nr:hypothetical protein HDV06_000018 [Boothiomyces sp. JEL0866]
MLGILYSSKVYADQIQTTVEPNTKTLIPNTVLNRFHLVGLGARKVTFLNITAYTISFYLPKKKFLESEIYDECCLQIIPFRDTDGAHLRNGFIRLLNKQSEKPTEKEIQEFKGLLAIKHFKKQSRLVFYKNGNILAVYFNDQLLGSMEGRLGELLIKGYFTNVSPSFTQSVHQAAKIAKDVERIAVSVAHFYLIQYLYPVVNSDANLSRACGQSSAKKGLYRNTKQWKQGPVSIPVSTFLIKHDQGWSLVDAGYDSHTLELLNDVKTHLNGDKLSHVFITHGHLDHIACLPLLLNEYPDLKIMANEKEFVYLTGEKKYSSDAGDTLFFNATRMFHHGSNVKVDRKNLFPVGDNESVGGLVCVTTHGHTLGSMSYIHQESKSIMVGDSLMNYTPFSSCPSCSIFGMTTCCMQDAKKSVEKILGLDIETIFPAHDTECGVSKEKIRKDVK